MPFWQPSGVLSVITKPSKFLEIYFVYGQMQYFLKVSCDSGGQEGGRKGSG